MTAPSIAPTISHRPTIADWQYDALEVLNQQIWDRRLPMSRRAAASQTLANFIRDTGIEQRLREHGDCLRRGIPDPRELEDNDTIVRLMTEKNFDPKLKQKYGIFREFSEAFVDENGKQVGAADFVVSLNDKETAKRTGSAISIHITYIVTDKSVRNPEVNKLIFNKVTEIAYNFSNKHQPKLTKDYPKALLTIEQNKFDDMSYKKLSEDSISPFSRAFLWLHNGLGTFDFEYEQPKLTPKGKPAANLDLLGAMVEFDPTKIGQGRCYKVLKAGVDADYLGTAIEKFFAITCVKSAHLDNDASVLKVRKSLQAKKNAQGKVLVLDRKAVKDDIEKARQSFKRLHLEVIPSVLFSGVARHGFRNRPFGEFWRELEDRFDSIEEALKYLGGFIPEGTKKREPDQVFWFDDKKRRCPGAPAPA